MEEKEGGLVGRDEVAGVGEREGKGARERGGLTGYQLREMFSWMIVRLKRIEGLSLGCGVLRRGGGGLDG